ncbi:MAG TPA: RNA-binding protein [Firmicutes bacterium]|jgi:predicted RNA-binding protein with PIN domain|nr:NYN domain-containing protein [Bacillota bacterium]HAA34878.1 RNA-binding protein [Bacillota bacterium]
MSLLIVDGYNIINSWPEFEELREDKMEIARIKLAEMLEEFVPLLWSRIIIVYDAYRVKGKRPSCEYFKGLEVIYTGEGETADVFIERLVVNLDGIVDDIEVASSDNLQQHLVLWKGGRRLSARELRERLRECRAEIMKSRPSFTRNNLDERLSQKVKEVLERWRRQ